MFIARPTYYNKVRQCRSIIIRKQNMDNQTEKIKINLIPHYLEDATYKQLQRMAKHYGIKANLKREELETALYEIIKK